jgi:hypothetical protein
MVDEGPKSPRDPRAPEESPGHVLLFAEDDEAEREQKPAWLRRSLGILVFVLAVVVGWWVYRTVAHSRAPVGEPPPVELTQPPTTPRYGAGLTSLSDTVLSGAVGSALALHVRAMSPSGEPLADTLVRFRVEEGSGAVRPDTLRTDEEGLVHAALTLPSRPERLVVAAEVVGAQLPGVRFTVTARSGRPSQVRIVDGDQQEAPAGTVLSRRLTVRVTDQAGTPVSDVAVRFQVVGGGGAVAPARSRTNPEGYAATLWRLGDVPGEQYAAAVVPDIGDALLTFTATALAPPPPEEPVTEQPDAPEPVTVTVSRRPFVVGGSFVCGLSGGRVSCRGNNDRGQRVRGASTSFVALAAGVSHACGLTSTGLAWCWGANESGQLGDASRTDRSSPVEVITDTRFSSLTAGVSHTCGLAAEGQAFCWGKDASGQLGDGSGQDRSVPVPVSGPERFARLVAGWNHTCGLTTAGEAFCWGLNDHGQLGDGSRQDRSSPVSVPGYFESLVAGSAHTCGIRDGQVFCWGADGTGQPDHTRPTRVRGLPARATRLAAGAVSTCALMADGSVDCWGQNVHGELGDGTRQSRPTPVPVAGDLSFRSIYAGGALTCGFADDGGQYCWGLNQSGQLGDGTRESRSVPTRVGG